MPISDRAKSGLVAFIRRVVGLDILGPRMDYLAAYPCKMVVQNADGTLELQPDDARLPGYSKVPIRYGVPGVSATISPGARVLLEFAGADPQKPIATVWESASVTQLTLTATAVLIGGAGATQPLVLGTTYATQMNALAAAITPLMLPPAAAAAKAAATALALAVSATNKTQ